MFADFTNATRTLQRALNSTRKPGMRMHPGSPGRRQSTKAKQLRIQSGRTKHNRKHRK